MNHLILVRHGQSKFNLERRFTGFYDVELTPKGEVEAEQAGADGITLHLREDLRHIQKRDVRVIKEALQTRMNLELAVTDKMLEFAEEIRPEHSCLVPEKREELTTEGGLDVVQHFAKVAQAVKRLQAIDSEVSLFIAPDKAQIDAAIQANARFLDFQGRGKIASHMFPTFQGSVLTKTQKSEFRAEAPTLSFS